MPRTREQLFQAAVDAEAWLDQLDPASTPAEDVSDLRAVAEAVVAVATAQTNLEMAVRAARGRGRSWGRIAIALGTSRQAARERYDDDSASRVRTPVIGRPPRRSRSTT